MTLATVPRYDSDRIASADGEAVVVGAGMAGLLAARVFADRPERFPIYLSRLLRRAHTDGTLRGAFGRVLMMERPPRSLFHPCIAWRVLKPTR